MNCPHCKEANEVQHHGYSTTCKGCRLRNISRHPTFVASMRAGTLSPAYLNLLRVWGVTHDEVKAASERDRMSAIHAAKRAWLDQGEGDD